MSVSVIIPIHNAGSHLLDTLESVYGALVDGDELITVFDSCTDNSGTLYEDWKIKKESHRTKDIEYVRNDISCGCISGSRNCGIINATKEWVAFVDHDDIVSPDIYTLNTDVGEMLNADVVRCGYAKLTGSATEEIYPDYAPDFYAFFGIFVWNGIFRRTFLQTNGILFRPGYGEDYEFNVEIARHCKRQCFVNECLYFWKIHTDNQHKKRSPRDFFSRVGSISRNTGSYLVSCPAARFAFTKWFVEYVGYIETIFPVEFVKVCASELQGTFTFLRAIGPTLNSFWATELSRTLNKFNAAA